MHTRALWRSIYINLVSVNGSCLVQTAPHATPISHNQSGAGMSRSSKIPSSLHIFEKKHVAGVRMYSLCKSPENDHKSGVRFLVLSSFDINARHSAKTPNPPPERMIIPKIIVQEVDNRRDPSNGAADAR